MWVWPISGISVEVQRGKSTIISPDRRSRVTCGGAWVRAAVVDDGAFRRPVPADRRGAAPHPRGGGRTGRSRRLLPAVTVSVASSGEGQAMGQ